MADNALYTKSGTKVNANVQNFLNQDSGKYGTAQSAIKQYIDYPTADTGNKYTPPSSTGGGKTGKATSTATTGGRLAVAGYPIAVDGIFGPQTTDAVKKFQLSKGLTPDGIIGPRTWAHL